MPKLSFAEKRTALGELTIRVMTKDEEVVVYGNLPIKSMMRYHHGHNLAIPFSLKVVV